MILRGHVKEGNNCGAFSYDRPYNLKRNNIPTQYEFTRSAKVSLKRFFL